MITTNETNNTQTEAEKWIAGVEALKQTVGALHQNAAALGSVAMAINSKVTRIAAAVDEMNRRLSFAALADSRRRLIDAVGADGFENIKTAVEQKTPPAKPDQEGSAQPPAKPARPRRPSVTIGELDLDPIDGVLRRAANHFRRRNARKMRRDDWFEFPQIGDDRADKLEAWRIDQLRKIDAAFEASKKPAPTARALFDK